MISRRGTSLLARAQRKAPGPPALRLTCGTTHRTRCSRTAAALGPRRARRPPQGARPDRPRSAACALVGWARRAERDLARPAYRTAARSALRALRAKRGCRTRTTPTACAGRAGELRCVSMRRRARLPQRTRSVVAPLLIAARGTRGRRRGQHARACSRAAPRARDPRCRLAWTASPAGIAGGARLTAACFEHA